MQSESSLKTRHDLKTSLISFDFILTWLTLFLLFLLFVCFDVFLCCTTSASTNWYNTHRNHSRNCENCPPVWSPPRPWGTWSRVPPSPNGTALGCWTRGTTMEEHRCTWRVPIHKWQVSAFDGMLLLLPWCCHDVAMMLPWCRPTIWCVVFLSPTHHLFLIACTCIYSVVEYFLSRKGIILSAIDRWGSTPMDDAMQSKHEGTIAVMKQALAASIAREQRAQRSMDKAIVNGWLNVVKNREIACAMRTWKMFVKHPTVQYSKQWWMKFLYSLQVK